MRFFMSFFFLMLSSFAFTQGFPEFTGSKVNVDTNADGTFAELTEVGGELRINGEDPFLGDQNLYESVVTDSGTATASTTGDALFILGAGIASTSASSDTITVTVTETEFDGSVANGGTGASTASGARSNLGLVIGTDIQPYDAGLASIAGLTTAADKGVYTTGADSYAPFDLTSFGRGLVGSASAAAARSEMGLGSMATQNLTAVVIEGGTIAGITDLAVADGGTGASTASGARGNLGLGSGDDVTFGAVTVADTGSEAAPAVTVGGTNYGIYIDQSSSLALVAGGAARVYVSNIGLGINGGIDASGIISASELGIDGDYTLGNAATDVGTLRGTVTLTDSSASDPLKFGDIDMYKSVTDEVTLDGNLVITGGFAVKTPRKIRMSALGHSIVSGTPSVNSSSVDLPNGTEILIPINVSEGTVIGNIAVKAHVPGGANLEAELRRTFGSLGTAIDGTVSWGSSSPYWQERTLSANTGVVNGDDIVYLSLKSVSGTSRIAQIGVTLTESTH